MKKAHPVNEGGPPEAWRTWASQVIPLGPALGIAGTQLCCCPSEEAEMNLPLVISLLNLIYRGRSVYDVLPSNFLPSDFLLGSNYFVIAVSGFAYQ